MILKIIDNNLKEYNYEFDSEIFSFNVTALKNKQYALTITNSVEIDISLKVKLINLFENIKKIDIKNITIENNSCVIFDSLSYNFAHDTFDYNNIYEINNSILFDRIKFTFIFIQETNI